MKRLIVLMCVLLTVSACRGQKKFSADAGECGDQIGPQITTSKTPTLTGHAGSIRMYGTLEFNRSEQDAKAKDCHVVYRLFVSTANNAFAEAYRLAWDTEDGEIAGIDLIGFSPNGLKAAANFWLAAGDGQENRPTIYDLRTHRALFRSLEQKLSDRIHRSCDGSYYESVDSVTDEGAVIISVPRVQDCVDGGLWLFDPGTGSLKQIRKNSGRKPVE